MAKHYEDYVKPWRESRRAKRQSPNNSEVIRDKSPLQDCLELVLQIPAEKKDVIRDEIRLLRVNSTTFAAYGP